MRHMPRSRTLIRLLFLLCAASTVRAEEAGRYTTGLVLSIDTGSISIQPPARFHGQAPNTETYHIDPLKLKVLRMDVGVGGVHTSNATTTDLHVGDRIFVKHTNDQATELRILPPPPVQGRIVAIGRGAITVRPTIPAAIAAALDQSFNVDDKRSEITSSTVAGAPARKIRYSDLQVGQGVSVLAKGRFAFVIRVLPAGQVMGTVNRVGASEITIKVAGRFPAGVSAEREFGFDPRKVEAFDQYFGEGVRPGDITDVAVGSEVAITPEAGKAIAITINHPAVYGTLSEVGSDCVTVIVNDGTKQVEHTFRIGDRTAIFVGSEDHSTKMASGKTLHIWRFAPGGHIGDLRVGEYASITAKGDQVISMRVRPAGSQAK